MKSIISGRKQLYHYYAFAQDSNHPNTKRLSIKDIELSNYRIHEDLKLTLDQSLTLIYGVNGSGKSAILNSVAVVLSWFIARFTSINSNGQTLASDQITYGQKKGYIKINIGNQTFQINSKGPETKSDYSNFNDHARRLNEFLGRDPDVGIPVFAYYPIGRSVSKVSVRPKSKASPLYSQFEAYEGALSAKDNFDAFFEWIRFREDIENEAKARTFDFGYKDVELEAVRQAVYQFLPETKDLRVVRSPRLCLMITKNEIKTKVEDMSDGEKCLLALVGDLARRLSIANPTNQEPLNGSGIVLIDEADLHLHPDWQRRFVEQLPKVFPNIQFIMTTHSPQMIGELPAKQVRKLDRDEKGNVVAYQPEMAIGLSSDDILTINMDSINLDAGLQEQFSQIYQDIDNGKFDEAETAISELKQEYGNLPKLIELESYLFMVR